MFQDHRLVVRYRDGRVSSGWAPEFTSDGQQVFYVPEPGSTRKRVAALDGAEVVLLMRPLGSEGYPTPRPGPARQVVARFASGGELRGPLVQIPVLGGVWLRPVAMAGDDVLAFVPDGAGATIKLSSELVPPGSPDPQTDPALEALDASHPLLQTDDDA